MLHVHGRFAGGFGWQVDPGELMERSSTALAQDGRVWVIDPVRAPGLEDEIAALGTVAAVVMTVGWHDRDVDWFATLFGVPVYAHPSLRLVEVRTPVQRVAGSVPESPLHIVNCGGRGLLNWWSETAIWWPEQQALVTGDVLGTAAYFLPAGRRVAVHPVRRLSPPIELRELPVERLYPGHGQSVTVDVGALVRDAIDLARPEIAASWWHGMTAVVRHYVGR